MLAPIRPSPIIPSCMPRISFIAFSNTHPAYPFPALPARQEVAIVFGDGATHGNQARAPQEKEWFYGAQNENELNRQSLGQGAEIIGPNAGLGPRPRFALP